MATESTEEALRQAVDALERTGLLFLHDARKPSLTALVAGAPIKGSWWGHAAGKRIFKVASALEVAGIQPTPGSTPKSTAEFLAIELAKWAPIIKASGAHID